MNTPKYNLAFIPAPTTTGSELLQVVEPIIADNSFILEVKSINENHEYANICAQYDAVILDATLEKDGRHNYRFALPTPAYHFWYLAKLIFLPNKLSPDWQLDEKIKSLFGFWSLCRK